MTSLLPSPLLAAPGASGLDHPGYVLTGAPPRRAPGHGYALAR